MKRGLVFLSFFLYFYAFAQDTVIELQAVQVSASRLNTFTAGLKILAFDSLALQKRQFNSLSELISEETPVFIKTYGQGSLATISFRGTAATHTGIYWNGIPLNPVTSGLFDLSLAPAGFFNSIRVLEGGSGSLFGSGNIGGSIHLNNEPVFGNGQTIQAGISAGSFQEYGGIFKTLTSARRIFSSTALMVKTAENDFRFQNLYNEKVTQQNAAFRQYGLIQDFYWKPTVNWMLGAAIWLQSGFREIPSTMVTGSSEADQQDKSIRTVISARKFFTLGSASLKLAYLHDSLHYRNPASLLDSDKDSRISSDRLLAEAQADRRLWKNMIISAGACLTGEYAVSNNFDGRVSQNRLGLYLSVLEVIPALKWKLNLNLRQDLTEGYKVPFTPALGLEGKIWRSISGKINFSRNFRVPTFNELFWKPYGNENLKPESSWNGEASLVIKPDSTHEHRSWELIVTHFNSVIDNWITWIPDGNDWKPQNYIQVWSRGFEFNGLQLFRIRDFIFRLNEGYTFAKSTGTKSEIPGYHVYQKQLIYTPPHRVFMNFYSRIKSFEAGIHFTYTGKRFTTSDNSHFLKGYWLLNLTAGKDFRFRKNVLGLRFGIYNLWNYSYQAIEYYPMPGISYKVSINYKFNSK